MQIQNKESAQTEIMRKKAQEVIASVKSLAKNIISSGYKPEGEKMIIQENLEYIKATILEKVTDPAELVMTIHDEWDAEMKQANRVMEKTEDIILKLPELLKQLDQEKQANIVDKLSHTTTNVIDGAAMHYDIAAEKTQQLLPKQAPVFVHDLDEHTLTKEMARLDDLKGKYRKNAASLSQLSGQAKQTAGSKLIQELESHIKLIPETADPEIQRSAGTLRGIIADIQKKIE